MNNLSQKHCVPCEGGVKAFSKEEASKLLGEVNAGRAENSWMLSLDAKQISREFVFLNFKEALAFVNRVGDVAEEEKHHPDIKIFAYKKVLVELSTHAIGGLSENDFILAAKINTIL
ncbi:4a-hydroxytetrahydrobiopterin dehydratase [bacterium]|nr:4a-hydroxytetrahydrobiopterin dehydratase [bacterium]